MMYQEMISCPECGSEDIEELGEKIEEETMIFKQYHCRKCDFNWEGLDLIPYWDN